MLAGAARRFLTLLAGIAGVTAVVSLALGAAMGAGVSRAVSLGLYAVGSFLLIAGFFVGNRGPARLEREEHGGLFGPRHVRWASPEEREGTINDSAIFVSIGFVLIILGLLADSREKLI